MAAIMPNIPGTGNNIPVSSYIAGISEAYPNVNRQRVVESSINSKEKVDFMPVNMGLNQSLTDKYLEFRINGVIGSFLDLSSTTIELFLNLNQTGGVDLTAETMVGLVNGLSNTIFKSVTVFINEKMVESNPFFNYTSYVKLLKSMGSSEVTRYGGCGFLHDDYNNDPKGVTMTYTKNTFEKGGTIENRLMGDIKTNGVHLCFPLLLDVSTLDMYLLDGVDVRIRLELASNAWIINTVAPDGGGVGININRAKLWIDRVIPHHNAITALNYALATKPIEYIFNKTLYKTFVIGRGESSIMIDQPFTNCIPDKLTMLLVDMNSISGRYNHNSLYFNHCDISNVHITINGSTIYNTSTDFSAGDCSRSFYEVQKAVGIDSNNMLSYDSYQKGRSVFCFNFVNETVEDSLPVERSANLRMNLTFKQPLTTPHVVILLADTTGIITIDNQRIITCDVRG